MVQKGSNMSIHFRWESRQILLFRFEISAFREKVKRQKLDDKRD